MIALKSGQVIRQASESQFNFQLPKGHILFWAAFEKDSQVWVVEANESKLKEILSAIQKRIQQTADPFLFLKYVCALEHAEQLLPFLDAELKVKGIKVEGKLLRSGPLQGHLDFVQRKLRVEKKIRLMIVDDSKTIRDLLRTIFSKDPDFEIVAVVDHPHQAQKLIPEIKPDVITLDIHMPEMDGVTLLKSYINQYPIPTVMISSITMEEGPMVFNALEAGAVDYFQKPSFNELAQLAPLMIETVKEASRSKVKVKAPVTLPAKKVFNGRVDDRTLWVMGASTGGTEALKEVFMGLPEKIPPTLVVQHIPAVFSKAFAERLNQICPFDVKEAQEGDIVRPNQVLIAPGGFQMEVVQQGLDLVVKITDAPPMNRHKPSVDYLFQSVAKIGKGKKLVAAILTGMGADGARGLKILKDLGAKTVVQNEATCIVFGMPKEAIKHGGADHVLPLDEIALKMLGLS